MPLLVAGLAIPTTLALIYLVAQQVEMSIYVLNIATMLGLALAIDYSLFIVSRFREELRRGRTVGDAVERAVATAGKAVAFCGLAVAIGLSGLLLFEAPAIRSIGIGGALVVLCSVVFALTFLPAVLGHARPARQRAVARRPASTAFRPVGRRASSRRPDRRAGSASPTASCAARSPSSSRRSPFLLLVGIPFLRLEQGVPGAEIYPPGVESRDAYVALQTEFAPGETTPIIILADVHGLADRPRPTSRPLAAYADAARRRSTASTGSRARSPIHDPPTGAALTPEQVAALYALPRRPAAAGLDAPRSAAVRPRLARSASTRSARSRRRSPTATASIPVDPRDRRRRRASRPQVGGSAATGHDFLVVAGRARPVRRRADAARERA